MKKQTATLLVLGIVLTVAGAGGTEESNPTASEPDSGKKTCFRVRNTRSFDAVDDRFVYLRCVRDKHYLLTMDNACFGLENSIGIRVTGSFDRVCSNDRAMITYREFNQTRRCGILKVEAVENRQAALEIIAKRKESAAAGGADEGAKENTAPGDPDGRR